MYGGCQSLAAPTWSTPLSPSTDTELTVHFSLTARSAAALTFVSARQSPRFTCANTPNTKVNRRSRLKCGEGQRPLSQQQQQQREQGNQQLNEDDSVFHFSPPLILLLCQIKLLNFDNDFFDVEVGDGGGWGGGWVKDWASRHGPTLMSVISTVMQCQCMASRWRCCLVSQQTEWPHNHVDAVQ